MADLADHAHAHALAVLGSGDAAAVAAATAVRRGGRSRTAVLGHARAEALAQAVDAVRPDLDQPAPGDLTELAVALATTRPPIERAVVDLELRHGLDRAAFGRALGASTAAASARSAAVATTWQQALDPVLLAHLGPGGCEGLASVLGVVTAAGGEDGGAETESVVDVPIQGRGSDVVATLRELLGTAPAVLDHAAGCSTCGDRLRSMVSVRTLVGQRPLDPAPAPVRAAAAPSRLRRPTAPPPLEPEPLGRRWLRPVAVVALTLIVAVAGGVVVASDDDDPTNDGSVEALTRVPAQGSVLVVEPAMVEGRSPRPVELTNRSDRPITWVAAGDADWLAFSPDRGSLAPDQSIDVRVSVTSAAPEGDLRGTVQITGSDGSAAVVRLTTTVERPPDVAASVSGCAVEATVEDEGEVAGAELHWFDPPATPGGRPNERIATMQPTSAGFAGQLPSATTAITWWVAASDARGNRARTADQVRPASTCP